MRTGKEQVYRERMMYLGEERGEKRERTCQRREEGEKMDKERERRAKDK